MSIIIPGTPGADAGTQADLNSKHLAIKSISKDSTGNVIIEVPKDGTKLGEKEESVMNIILLGAPGAGKGTQADVISEHFAIQSISTGNIIREALKSGTELGKRAKSFMDKGALVPDEIVVGIIKERLSKGDLAKGFILDGFPRTIPQAKALDELGVKIDKVIDIEVNDEVIIPRMSGRRVCENCGASYHLVNKKPQVDGICDKCHGTLVQRKDDQIETVKERLKVYHEQTEPLKDYYKRQHKLVEINGNLSLDETKKLTLNALEA